MDDGVIFRSSQNSKSGIPNAMVCVILYVAYKRTLASNWKQVADVMVEIGFLSSCLSVRSQLKAPALRSAPGNRSGRLGFAPTTDTFGWKEERKEV